MKEPIDAIFDLIMTVLILMIGLFNISQYAVWVNSNVFADVAHDKIKAASTYTEPKLSDYTLTAEQVAYMVHFKRNDFTMACPTLCLDLPVQKGSSTTNKIYVEPMRGIQWTGYVQGELLRNQIGHNLYYGDKYKIIARQWRPEDGGFAMNGHVIYPIECAITNQEAAERTNPMFGISGVDYFMTKDEIIDGVSTKVVVNNEKSNVIFGKDEEGNVMIGGGDDPYYGWRIWTIVPKED